MKELQLSMPSYVFESADVESQRKRRIQRILNQAGASNLVVDLIMKNPSYKIFSHCIELAKALLDGGNTEVQVKKDLL